MSLTRVIGPCRIGYFVPCDFASGPFSTRCSQPLFRYSFAPLANSLDDAGYGDAASRESDRRGRHPGRRARRPTAGSVAIRARTSLAPAHGRESGEDSLARRRSWSAMRACAAGLSGRLVDSIDSPRRAPRTVVSLPSRPASRFRADSESGLRGPAGPGSRAPHPAHQLPRMPRPCSARFRRAPRRAVSTRGDPQIAAISARARRTYLPRLDRRPRVP